MLSLCDRFHCLPSQLEEEDSEIIRLVAIQAMGARKEAAGGQQS